METLMMRFFTAKAWNPLLIKLGVRSFFRN
jgi:hypothetical protein